MIIQVQPGEIVLLSEAGVYEDLPLGEHRGVPAPHLPVVVAEVLLLPEESVQLQQPAVVERSGELAQAAVHHQSARPVRGERVERPGRGLAGRWRSEHVGASGEVDGCGGHCLEVDTEQIIEPPLSAPTPEDEDFVVRDTGSSPGPGAGDVARQSVTGVVTGPWAVAGEGVVPGPPSLAVPRHLVISAASH